MTVAELIVALQAMDPTLEVMTEGCDCWGDIAELRVVDGVALTCRSDGDTLRKERPRVVVATKNDGPTPMRPVDPNDMDDPGFRRFVDLANGI